MAGGVLAGTRVSLRPMGELDLETVEAWFDEAVAAAGNPHPLPLARSAGEGRCVDARAGGVFVIERPGERGLVGVVEYAVEGRALTVCFIALAKPYRGWGYGSEAVRLLEEWAVREGVAERFLAEVPVVNGLGLYFWLRLGYRPASAAEFDWQRDEARDKMPMVRASASA